MRCAYKARLHGLNIDNIWRVYFEIIKDSIIAIAQSKVKLNTHTPKSLSSLCALCASAVR